MIKKYKLEIIIFAVALLLRLVFAVFSYDRQYIDSVRPTGEVICPFRCSDGYYEIANNLINKKIFSFNSTEPFISNSIRTPFYPLLMVSSIFVFNSLWPLFILQIIISSLLPILGRRISLEITENKSASNAVAWLLAFEPVGIWLSIVGLTETFFTFVFLLFALAMIKFVKITRLADVAPFNQNKVVVLAAFLLGVAALTKPVIYYLPVVLIICWLAYQFFLKRKIFLKQIIIFLAMFILVISPWLYRNYKVFNAAALSSSKEDVLFGALAPSVLAIKNNASYAESQKVFFKQEGFKSYPLVNLDKAGWFQDRASREIKKHPKELVIISGVSLLTFFTHDGALSFLSSLGLADAKGLTIRQILAEPLSQIFKTFKTLLLSPLFFVMLMRAFWILVAILFILYLYSSLRKKEFNAISVFALILIIYFALTTISNGYCVNARFRFPVNAFILAFAADYFFQLRNNRMIKKLNI